MTIYKKSEGLITQYCDGCDFYMFVYRKKSINFLLLFSLLFTFILAGAIPGQAASAAPTAGDTAIPANKPAFTDIGADSALYPSVRYLVDKGIFKGFPDGSFRPAENMTRA